MRAPPTQQQGMALVEALIASAILGIGLVGATQLTLKTLNSASQNRQHMVAQQLAQDGMDCLRAMAAMPAPANPPPCPSQETLQVQGVTYTRQAQSNPASATDVRDLYVRVSWPALGMNSQPGSLGLGSETAHRIEWHSSVSALPFWVGVSLP